MMHAGRGGSGWRSEPSPQAPPYDCVTALLHFLRLCPPPVGVSGSLFGHPAVFGLGCYLVLRETAARLDLDPRRLLTHGIRVGGAVQLQNFSDAVTMSQGNWSSVGKMLAYACGSLQHASTVAETLHDLR
jgi:hypothetical protein